jgi:hypothetical protein
VGDRSTDGERHNFLVSLTLLSLARLISRSGTGHLYPGCACRPVLFFARGAPETKGRGLRSIQREITEK